MAHARKGITPVIAIVLLLMMTVAAAGMAYVWITEVQQEMQGNVGGSMRAKAAQMSGDVAIDMVYEIANVTQVSVRNTGSITFTKPVKIQVGTTICPSATINAPQDSAVVSCPAGTALKEDLVITAIPPEGIKRTLVCNIRPETDTSENDCAN